MSFASCKQNVPA